MELVWDDEALADLEDIFDWIAQESPAAAKTVVDRLFSSTELLIDFPFMGHAGRESNTFEWAVPRLPYIVVYEVDRAPQRIVVTAVVHGAQERDGGE
ncbi:type II toxin-antitoxin system RelE/ParE family toxin [Bradyrhizobium sp.]|uniref:type II toxin-antitoxin system RelE/ParE family toxin n=1 Tax=Bradyrhizobium sp. TaxID=376 RepID=UPI002E0BC836|nr:type II toxin-antitoxin system RelE/ParE family toxin [Bradyrhizobium sp.]